MHRLMLIGLLFCLMVIGCQRMVTISSGTKVVCLECGKTMNADIRTFQVPVQEAIKYSVHETTEICPTCQVKIAALKHQEEARRREETARAERQRLAESRSRLAGIWHGNWDGWDVHLSLKEDGTGFFQQSSFAGGMSHNILWKVNRDSIRIKVLANFTGEDLSYYTLDGSFHLQGNNLSINHRRGRWVVYSRQ